MVTASDRRAVRHATTKAEIVDVAWHLARERGLAGWALRDVAEAVGMRAPSLYVYFDSKNALYDAMFADAHEKLLAWFDADARIHDDSPVVVLRASAKLFVDFCVEN